jgi:hypothetical protein
LQVRILCTKNSVHNGQLPTAQEEKDYTIDDDDIG